MLTFSKESYIIKLGFQRARRQNIYTLDKNQNNFSVRGLKSNQKSIVALFLLFVLTLCFSFSGVFINAKAEELSTDQIDQETITESVSSLDANYILSSQTYANTPTSQFSRAPKYGVYDFSDIRVGDIIYESDFLNGIGHAAIVSDVSHASGYGTYIQTIEAVPGGSTVWFS